MKISTIICSISLLCLPIHGFTADYLELSLPGKRIALPESSWSLTIDEANFAKTYEQKETGASHKYGRVVTVFLSPMPNNRKAGIKISDNEYLEVLIVHEGFVTTQLKVDKGKYWVQCRETFLPKPRLSADVSSHKAFLSELKKMSLWMDYQPEVEESRQLLQTVF
jgi:hypothetical protein